MRQAEEYPSFRAGLAAESRLKLRMGLFDGFAARSLEQGAQVYESLADVTPRREFLGSAEVLLSFHLTDALALLFPLAAGLTLLTHERASGLLNLTRPTRFGRSRVYGRKLAAAATLSTVGFVLLYGINALIAGLLYGFAGLDAPVQSLYGFAALPLPNDGGRAAGSVGGDEIPVAAVLHGADLPAVRPRVQRRRSGWLRGGLRGHSRPHGGQLPIMAAESQPVAVGGRTSPVREAVYLNLLGSPSDRVLLGAIFLAALAVIAGIGRRGAVCPNPRRFRQAGDLYMVASPPPAHLPGGTRAV